MMIRIPSYCGILRFIGFVYASLKLKALIMAHTF